MSDIHAILFNRMHNNISDASAMTSRHRHRNTKMESTDVVFEPST